MRINNNIMALNAHRQLAVNQTNASKSMERLSSGMRINRAGDDAAGLAISEKMRGQIRGLKQAARNAQDGISLIQTAEGALNETHAILQRMRELATQASNDTNTVVDRKEIQKEINELIDEIDRIGNTTQFNTQNLLDSSFTGKFHIGANADQNIELSIADMRTGNIGKVTKQEATSTAALTKTDFTDKTEDDPAGDDDTDGFKVTVDGTDYNVVLDQNYATIADVVAAINEQLDGSGVSVSLDATNRIVFTSNEEFVVDPGTGIAAGATTSAEVTKIASLSALKVDPENAVSGGVLTQADANDAITAFNNAIETVSAERSKLGAYQNRLEHTIANLGTSAENLQAAESRIRDLDMAEEMMAFTKNNILQQAATAMLAQANMAPQSVLQLLG
jgi:flagellin